MSLSNPQQGQKSPVQKYFSWAGKQGLFTYYDKEKKEKIESKLPFFFVVLDTCFSISGFSKKNECNIYSNYFKTKNDPIKVKYAKDNELIVGGTWGNEDVKDKIKARGGKFCVNVFIMDSNKKISCLRLTGTAMGAWFEFTKQFNLEKNPFVQVRSSKTEKTDAGISYEVPTFNNIETTKPESLQEAIKLDQKLQDYFKSIGIGKAVNLDNIPNDNPFSGEEPMSDPQFTNTPETAVAGAADDDLPF